MERQPNPIVRLAKAAVEDYIGKGIVHRPEELTTEMKERAGVFVSIKKRGQLRGCIGTFEPNEENVAAEIVTNAISSATSDPRFKRIEASELSELEYSVDILTPPELVSTVDQLDPKKYGLIVEHGFKRGLLLPDLEGVNTIEQQINVCRTKAGISADEPINLYRFQVRRYK